MPERYEPDALSGAALAAVLALSSLGVALCVWGTGLAVARRAGEVRPLQDPEVRHWAEPEAWLASVRAEERRALEGYAWVDRERGLVRIPIERAMELVAEREAAPEPGGER